MLNKVRYINTKGNRHMACCLFLFMAGLQLSHAQNRGTVEVVKDARIDTLLLHRLQPAKSGGSTSSNSTYISSDGYRVQFFSGTNRAEAYSAQEKFRQKFPDLRTYITYREPNFKVRAGDFRTRMEAAKLVQDMRAMFPALFIVSEKINPPVQ